MAMKKSKGFVNKTEKKKPGRPRKGAGYDPVFAFRLPEALKKRLEKEAEANGEKPGDTMRRIVDEHFKGKGKR
jgi:hypothetical protein